MPPRLSSSKDLNAAVERVAPDVLALIGDGMPRNTISPSTFVVEDRRMRRPSGASGKLLEIFGAEAYQGIMPT